VIAIGRIARPALFLFLCAPGGALLHFIPSRATIRREAMLHAVLIALAFGWRVLRRRTS
jgi:hypothetical protein